MSDQKPEVGGRSSLGAASASVEVASSEGESASGEALPEGWAVSPIEDFAKTATGGTPSRKRDDYYGGDIPWVKSGDLTDGLVTKVDERITQLGLDESNAKMFPKGAVCIALYGATVGKLGILEMAASTNQAVCGIFPEEGINTRYVFHSLRNERENLIGKAQGGAQPNISNGIIKKTDLRVAPKAEQSRIVSAIESLQERSSRARVLLSEVGPLIGQLRQSVLRAAFSGQLTADWRAANPDVQSAKELVESLPEPPKPNRAKKASIAKIPGDSGLSVGLSDKELPSTWSCTRLTRIGQLVTGHTPSRKHPEYWHGDIPWIGIKDAGNNDGKVIESTLQHVTQLGLDNSASRLLPKGTVLMTRTANSIGYCVVLGKDMATSQDLVGWIFPKEINPKYIMYLILGEHDALYRFAKGSAHPTVYFPEILSLHVALPPTEEQDEIVKRVEQALLHLETIGAEVASMESSLTVLDQSILSKAFRGELVPQDPRDEPASELLARIRTTRAEEAAKSKSKSKPKTNKTTGGKSAKTSAIMEVLQKAGQRMEIDRVRELAKMKSKDFYSQLKEHVKRGEIREDFESDEHFLTAAES
ncbi:restriction endonuclease subunit S [Planctomycetes bacterium K23_9]|uniref:Type-1 restriction enzyme EcoKI specificity protein n=1 Tax=Stieleria marina TaxID=1930275 RepID=A0A517NUG0_9BACT|nr:Type-1 restriction enzyme EcoKI specificity protein [Planctomycetes bacterium K23_9]